MKSINRKLCLLPFLMAFAVSSLGCNQESSRVVFMLVPVCHAATGAVSASIYLAVLKSCKARKCAVLPTQENSVFTKYS